MKIYFDWSCVFPSYPAKINFYTLYKYNEYMILMITYNYPLYLLYLRGLWIILSFTLKTIFKKSMNVMFVKIFDK